MLVAKVVLPISVLFLVNLASEARHHSHLSRVLQSSDDRSSHVWEREERDRYFVQCRFVNAWKEHLGYVSVLAFLDPAWNSWQYSFRQAVMLELLSSRLRKSGFPDIRFFMISPFAGSPTKNERSDENVEIEAWREIEERGEMDNFLALNFLKSDRSKITILWDDPRSRLWERFRASKDQVIIIDRCGKLTYHVIVPWSILFFPYVKAAILSTYEEDPCGGCNPTAYRTSGDEEYNLKFTKTTYEKESLMHNTPEINTDTTSATDSLDTLDKPEAEKTSIAASNSLQTITSDPTIPTESFTESTIYLPQDQESSMFSEGNTVHNQTVTIFELQTEAHPLANNLPTPANYESYTLSLDKLTVDKIESDTISAEDMTTASSFADEIRDKNTTVENPEHFKENAFLPLRIIMHAPYVVHENPDFHERFEFKIASPTDSRQNSDSRLTNSEEYDWETTEANNDDKNADQKYIFDEDETLGFYGEIAEYAESNYEDITDRNKTINDAYSNSTTDYNEEHYANDRLVNLSKSDESYVIENVTEDPNVEGFTDSQNITVSNIDSFETINTNNQVDTEEEMRQKLIEHYKKLLPWVDYRLNK